MAGKPATIDLQIIRGDDFDQMFQIVTCDVANPSSYPTGLITAPVVIDGATFTPLDLTGSTVLSQIRRTTAYAETLLVQFTVTINNASQGLYTLSLSNAETTALSSNDSVKYRYDTQVNSPNGKVTTYVMGAVDTTLDVTRL